LLVVTAISAFGNGVLRPVITSEITKQVGRHEQGAAIGISGSLNSLAMTIAPPIGGNLIGLAGPLEHIVEPRWLIVWTLLPATAAVIGLIAALIARKRTAAEPAADAARS
jgi:MFS family permease